MAWNASSASYSCWSKRRQSLQCNVTMSPLGLWALDIRGFWRCSTDPAPCLFQPISTRVPGIRICDQMPPLANFMDNVAIGRSVTHKSDTIALVGKGGRACIGCRRPVI